MHNWTRTYPEVHCGECALHAHTLQYTVDSVLCTHISCSTPQKVYCSLIYSAVHQGYSNVLCHAHILQYTEAIVLCTHISCSTNWIVYCSHIFCIPLWIVYCTVCTHIFTVSTPWTVFCARTHPAIRHGHCTILGHILQYIVDSVLCTHKFCSTPWSLGCARTNPAIHGR